MLYCFANDFDYNFCYLLIFCEVHNAGISTSNTKESNTSPSTFIIKFIHNLEQYNLLITGCIWILIVIDVYFIVYLHLIYTALEELEDDAVPTVPT